MPQEGIQGEGVQSLRDEVETAIGEAVRRLREIDTDAQARLREAQIEKQHLDSFLDELQYRLRSATSSGELRMTITGPLTENQLSAMQDQQVSLEKHKVDLGEVTGDLEQLSTRIAWLVHQIEGARDWVLAEIAPPAESDNGSEAGLTDQSQPDAGEQVMWAQIAMGQEAERARLAREIHDGPAQALANTVLRLQFVEQMLRHRPAEVETEIARVRAALQESLKDVRRFIFNLRPASLTDAGLIPTLRYYTQDYTEQFGLEVELNVPDNLVLSANQELVVFRIIQEALQNIHKHAEATKVEVNVQQRLGGPLVVTISDDGRGFDPKLVRQGRTGSSGLVSMRERASTVGGTLKVESRPGGGTTVTLVLPMPKSQ
jgi:two-component system, NarL family, sensor histidine kinase DegS